MTVGTAGPAGAIADSLPVNNIHIPDSRAYRAIRIAYIHLRWMRITNPLKCRNSSEMDAVPKYQKNPTEK